MIRNLVNETFEVHCFRKRLKHIWTIIPPIREACNAIAHQGLHITAAYQLCLKNPGYLYYANGGSFIPGTLQNVLTTKGPQRWFPQRMPLPCYGKFQYD